MLEPARKPLRRVAGAPARASAAPSSAAARQRRYRRRQHDGLITVAIDVDARLVGWLVRTEWLTPREVHTKTEIAAAITALLKSVN